MVLISALRGFLHPKNEINQLLQFRMIHKNLFLLQFVVQ